MGKKNFYAVKAGFQVGLFTNWPECQSAVKGYKGAVYKGFETKDEALAWLEDGGGDATASMVSINAVNAAFAAAPGETGQRSAPPAIDYEVYTDGSYREGRYSYGYAFIKDGAVIYESKGVGEDPEAAGMRNVAGEIAAVRHAVEKAKELQVRILIHHDYSGISHWVSGQWQAKNKFTQAYAAFMRAHRGLYEFKKVTGHSGDKYNDYVDRLAKEALGIRT